MKTVTAGAHGVNNVVVDGSETVKFSFASTCLAMEVLEGEVTVALTDTAVAGDDETRTISEGTSGTFPHQRIGVDTYYLTGTGKVNLWASNKDDTNPFEGKSKGGDGGGGRTETVLWENDGTTNPDTITLSEAITNFDKVVFYLNTNIANRGAVSNTYLADDIIAGSDNLYGGQLSESIYVWYKCSSSTALALYVQGSLATLTKIIGIKY